MNRGSEGEARYIAMVDGRASMRPRFMNRGSRVNQDVIAVRHVLLQ